MHNEHPKIQYMKDYQPADFAIDKIFLHFDLHEEQTYVKSILFVRRITSNKEAPLILDGEELILKHIRLNGLPLPSSDYQQTNEHLMIPKVPDSFTLETEVIIKPQENTKLSGLYKSRSIFCTQCESHGFRRITFYLDRPDVLSQFTTTISADVKRYPILLSNGNLIEERKLADGRHWVQWQDPTLKPAYLFALVAGDLDYVEDKFITMSGRSVKLLVYVEAGKRNQAHFALESLKKAMKWDEETYGREYELDIYMIVAVSDFNFGAMENKGLNIFNDKYILAEPVSATDDDFINILDVVGHEYFHNWSGNRVTVRDWFQITLKEGLTAFRDQTFTADMTSKTVKRIQEVKIIRSAQYAQDAGPMAHPIQPDSYIEVNNFYTVTVYNKGAEVIRMLRTILGVEKFRQAMDLYYAKYDGQAVTTAEFVKSMEEVSGLDLTQFRLWYSQAGTPVLTVTDSYDEKKKQYTLLVKQQCPPTPGQPDKKPFHIPLAMALFDNNGKEISLQLQGEKEHPHTLVLNVKKTEEKFVFTHVPVKPIPSLLKNYSAPVKLNFNYSEADRIFLMQHETDEFNRWDAAQQLAVAVMLENINNYQNKKPLSVSEHFLKSLQQIFQDKHIDDALKAEMLTLPSEHYLVELMTVADIEAIHHVREWLYQAIGEFLKDQFVTYYKNSTEKTYQFDAESVGRRRLHNLVLHYLTQLSADFYSAAYEQFKQTDNMTNQISALAALIDHDCAERKEALSTFYKQWKDNALVMDKWFALQAQSSLPNTLEVVKKLMHDPIFDIKNPNRARSLIAAFGANLTCLHNMSGEGYRFLADQAIAIDKFNPQTAARIVEPLIQWKKFDQAHQKLMREQLERIKATPMLSKNVYELVTKSLEQ